MFHSLSVVSFWACSGHASNRQHYGGRRGNRIRVYLFGGAGASAEYAIVVPISPWLQEARRGHLPKQNCRDRREGEEQARGSDKLVFECTARRSGARGDRKLPVYRAQVGIASPRTDRELFGDLGGGQPLRHQAQDFDLASGEAE